MRHDSLLGRARCCIDVPRLRRSGYQHAPRGRARPPQRLVQNPHGGRGPGHLDAPARKAVQLVVGRRVLDLHLVEADLLRQEHRHRRKGPLTHFDLTNDHGHAAVPADANERIGREYGRRHLGGGPRARPRVEMPADQQSSAGGSASEQDLPAGYAAHGQPPLSARACAARLMASRMRG